MTKLTGAGLVVGYGDRVVIEGVDVSIPEGSFTVIVGPNACGKSTLLKALARLIPASAGQVTLDGKAIHELPSKELARRLGLLPQSSLAPDGITVQDLVSRGRFPHQSLLSRWSREDERVVAEAMAATGVTDLRGRLLDELSPEGNGSASGCRWCSRRRHPCCSWTSRRPTWTSPTRLN